MPNTKSAKKRLRQNVVRRAHNRAVKSSLRSSIRSVREAVAASDFEKAEEQFRATVKKLDKAGAKRVLHPKTTSRLKSRLSHHIKTAKQKASA
ncbi:30S ribosomal protein S20 [Bremerella cremea]|uniref:Small ribosomal subunit protein bS20 n=1 Tax=Blastopirellula marina TaxID=124 RepID=A0A2S8FQU5_9BACT|nr:MULTISPECIES: 30S ribosomal protein S20 [Pirellulaceae]PQO34561.1 30S ribosomal protein S20 [Blastopirellula marina]RCS47057.1 30S ribosomal protein S20 [Bremerella cremea]